LRFFFLMSDAGNGGQNGVSFDVFNKTNDPVVICGLDVSLDPGIHTVQVWQVTNGTSAIAEVNNPAHWSLIASSTVTSLGTSSTGVSTVFTPFPAMNVLLQPNTTVGFMVSTASGQAINYSTGNATTSPVGATYAQDANIELRVGHEPRLQRRPQRSVRLGLRIRQRRPHRERSRRLLLRPSGCRAGR
jgi:hypothetical protein